MLKNTMKIMKTKLFALTALSVLTLGVATGCNKTPSTTDVTIAAAVEWNVDEGKAMLEGQKVKINDESIVTGKHGNTIFIQQVTGDKVSNINPIEVVLASSTDAAKVAFRDWVIVEGTVTSVNGRVILTDAKLLNVEKKSSDESQIYGYSAERSFISDVGRSYSGFCGFDAVLELTSDPEELVAGTDTTLVCVYPGEPTDEEIAKKLGITIDKVREVYKISQDPVSLETPIGEEEDSHLGDFLKDERTMSPEEYATTELLKEELSSVLLTLTDREEKVLRLRFGLYDGRTRTLEEVGKEFNVTRERIRQIEAKALRKLKHPNRSKRLKDFFDK